MIIEFSEVDDSRVRWNSGGEWKSADIEELIAAYERKHGKWIGVSPMVDTEECSLCGFQIQSSELATPYCPWCGAQMENMV